MASSETIKSSTAASYSGSQAKNRGSCGLKAELASLRKLVTECEDKIREGTIRRLPGNVAFLSDGRVLCRERSRGDSRYPYGSDGFNFWVNASGAMHGNRGLYFLFLPATSEGQEPPIGFFSGSRVEGGKEYVSHSILPTPFLDDGESEVVDRFTIIGHDATYFFAETSQLRTVVRVFLDQLRPEHAHINFSVSLENLTDGPIETYSSAYLNPFCRHQFVESSEDRWFKKISVDSHSASVLEQWNQREAGGTVLPPFVITTNEDVDRFSSVTNYALLRRVVSMRDNATGQEIKLNVQRMKHSTGTPEQLDSPGDILAQECTSRLNYLGGSPRRSLTSAEFLKTGQIEREVPLTVFNENATIGDLLRLKLPGGAALRADYIFSIPENSDVLDLEMNRLLGPLDVDGALTRVQEKTKETGDLSISVTGSQDSSIESDTFNKFVSYLKKQVAVCAMLKGYMSPSPNSLIGFRDVLQAIDGHLFDRPDEARFKILETMSHVLEDGRCPRQYSLPVNGAPGRTDLREFIDQGVWAISTVYNYLAVTGDVSLLDEQVGYHKITSADESVTYPSGKKDSVLDHLLRIMDYLGRQRDPETGLVLALYGDWNDALDGLGVSSDATTPFGTGVSVMTSLQLYANCAEIVEILKRYSPAPSDDSIGRYERLRSQLRAGLLKYAVVRQGEERRILHGWGDKRKYLVCSFKDSDGLARDGLTSNAFWVLSNMLEEDQSLQEDVLAALDRLDSPYGYITFNPGFAPDSPGVGRITKLPRGTAENGAAYIHATTFGIAALFQMGQPQKAWEQIAKILPFAPHHKDPSHSPFVMPNSYVNNPQLNLTGQSMNDWQTGCSNVLLKLLIRYAFGFLPAMEGVEISPAGWIPFEGFELKSLVHGRSICMKYERADVTQREFELNGQLLENILFNDVTSVSTVTVPYESLSKDQTNLIVVRDPLAS